MLEFNNVCTFFTLTGHTTGLILYALKTSEKLWFSDVFRGYRNRALKQVKSILVTASMF